MNIILIQNALLIAKILVESVKIKEFIVNILDTKIISICNAINVLLKYN